VNFVRIPLEGEAESPGLVGVLRKFSALVDAEDAELVRSLGPWNVANSPYKRRHRLSAYSRGPEPGERPTLDTVFHPRPLIYLHDLVMGAGPGEKVWALNDDLLDCRKSNLRMRKSKAVSSPTG
jgi:hypothetical protein